jgi:hypothetical protein
VERLTVARIAGGSGGGIDVNVAPCPVCKGQRSLPIRGGCSRVRCHECDGAGFRQKDIEEAAGRAIDEWLGRNKGGTNG